MPPGIPPPGMPPGGETLAVSVFDDLFCFAGRAYSWRILIVLWYFYDISWYFLIFDDVWWYLICRDLACDNSSLPASSWQLIAATATPVERTWASGHLPPFPWPWLLLMSSRIARNRSQLLLVFLSNCRLQFVHPWNDSSTNLIPKHWKPENMLIPLSNLVWHIYYGSVKTKTDVGTCQEWGAPTPRHASASGGAVWGLVDQPQKAHCIIVYGMVWWE